MSEFDDSKRIALERQGWHCMRCGANIHDPSRWPGRSGHHRQLRARRIRMCGTVPPTSSSCVAAVTQDATAGSTSMWQRRSGWD